MPGQERVVGRNDDPAAAQSLALDDSLDLNAAVRLHGALTALRGAPIVLDASAVQHLGAQCGQVLVAALRAWAGDGLSLTIADPSAAFGRGARLLGLQSVLHLEGPRP